MKLGIFYHQFDKILQKVIFGHWCIGHWLLGKRFALLCQKGNTIAEIKSNPVTIAHSPDADDIFMYYAIRFGWVSTPAPFENVALDIETLNEAAIAGTYDVTAISFALYPKIREDFALLRTAVSFGEGYGPKLIKKKGTRLRRNFKVALSGKHTTNAMLFRIAYPEARIVYKNFLEIEEAVLSGEVHAGVLIHESILDFDESLEVEREIWDIWQELAGGDLPLPLGGMALRRSIPLTRAIAIEEALIKAVDVANRHRGILAKMLLERDLVRIDAETLDTYLDLYANDKSVTMDQTQLTALDTLFRIGYEHGFYECPIRAEDFMIPHEYIQERNS
jgi:1,4-dihydroxy-6-naphthoate synthase